MSCPKGTRRLVGLGEYMTRRQKTMREIKFKLVKKGILQGIVSLHPNGIIAPAWEWDTAYEYTGLHDKNGKEIYEGDILGGIWKECYIAWCEKCKSFEVFFDTEVFPKYCNVCNGDAHWCEVVEDDGKLEVIGNIYENPELLEVK